MKRLLSLIGMMSVLAACGSKEEPGDKNCSTNSDCERFQNCVDNRCVGEIEESPQPLPAQNTPCTETCGDHEICAFGECVDKHSSCYFDCTPNTICVYKYFCVDLIHFDVTPCSPECDEPDFCYDGECVPFNSCLILGCQAPLVCDNHVCVEK